MNALRTDYRTADVADADREMLDFVAQMTREAWKLTPERVQRLHSVGFDDKAVLQMTLIAAWFNYTNRVADALGVGKG